LGGGVRVAFAQTADLVLSPSSGSYSVGDTIRMKIQIGGSAEFNSSEAALTFDKTKLRVTSLDDDNAVFNLWTTDPAFSNTAGTISYGGGSTKAIGAGNREIITVIFTTLAEGAAKVSFSEGTVLSGPGIDITGNKGSATFTIGAGTVPDTPVVPDTPKTTPTQSGPAPVAPTVSSNVFTEPDSWYATTSATFSWTLPYDVTSVRLLYDDDETSVPTVDRGRITSRELTELEEGESYFHIMFRNATGWGAPTHYRILVDVTPPSSFDVSVAQPDRLSQDVVLRFEASDEPSGIERYEIFVDGSLAATVSPEDMAAGSYTLNIPNPGERVFTVKAYDLAGNSTVSETTFTVIAAVQQQTEAKTPDEEELEDEGINWGYWATLILVAGIAFLIGAIMYERKANQAQRELILKEANEAREKIEGVFSVLRDEVEERVISLATKPNMTESERQTLEKLKEALEISEELLDKEIEDVRKMLQ
jgi:hypothetical protein